MTIRNRRKFIDQSGPDMTPMLDIVFIMLIFFIVTSVFLDETAMDFSIQQTPETSPTNESIIPIKIYVDADNAISVDDKSTELSNVAFAVQGQLAEKPAAPILLMAHQNADWDPVVRIRDKMDAAGRKTMMRIVK